MSMTPVHAVLVRRLDFLHEAFIAASDGLASVQFRQVGARCNHANWLIGHHLWEKDVLLVEWPSGRTSRPAHYDELYGFGSKPEAAARYPDCDELRRRIAESHAQIVAGLTPERLTQPCAAAPPMFPTLMDCALHFIHDASYHMGQLDYVRKLALAT